MEMNNIYSVLMTAITTLGGAAAWRYYEKRAEKKEKDEDWIKSDCKDRISKLEALLEASSKEKEHMRAQILELSTMVAKLQTQIQYLSDRQGKGL
jgi:predicted RNase H-like nuclease (RuvC/YqgF family)